MNVTARPRWRRIVLAGAFLAAFVHLAAALGWGLAMPGGFPWLHSRTWANTTIPFLVAALAVVGLVAVVLGRDLVAGAVTRAWFMGWLGLAVSAAIAFPASQRRVVLGTLVPLGGLGLGLVVWARVLGARTLMTRGGIGLAAVAMAVGAWLPLTQRAPAPTTQPAASGPLPAAPAGVGTIGSVGFSSVGKIDGRTAEMILPGSPQLTVRPRLRFRSRSADGGWSLFASRELRGWTDTSASAGRMRPTDAELWLTGEVEHHVRIDARDDRVVEVTTLATLAEPVHAHIATWCELVLTDHVGAAVSFSPCPDVVLPFLPYDYPVGRPAHLAVLDPDGTFRVLVATSGEKGPFHELGRGTLGRDDALVVTLHSDDQPALRVTLHDWASQASTDLSPTAGWGLPQNAIQFERTRDAADAPARLRATLADTAIGRGFDTVTHTAGTYRNRITIERLR